jgi:hypothetical protein
MIEEFIELGKLPLVFWLAVAIWLVLVAETVTKWREVWAKPAVVVYGTIAAWYLGDLLYTGIDHFSGIFPARTVSLALWQVILFLVAYRWLVWWLVPIFFQGLPVTTGPILIDRRAVSFFFLVFFLLWLSLFLIAVAIDHWRVLAVLWPPSAPDDPAMFSHAGVGSGTDFLLATGGYLYVLVCSAFGVLLVLNRGLLRVAALIMILLSWPDVWFGVARNTMLALLLPGVMTYWLFDRSWWQLKAVLTLVLFLFVNSWFSGVETYRGGEGLRSVERMNFAEVKDVDTHHEGLDMLEELCWMDSFISIGMYHPNMGLRYLDEAANVIPRTFWVDKPMPGIDYAMLRGFGGNNDSKAGVFATVATGMIGQGVANFGRFFGVLAAALLMVCWTGILSRLWLQRYRLPRLFLFVIGCGLTFNMGRDITLLVLWPFCFGMIGVLIWERISPPRPPTAAPSAQPSPPVTNRRPSGPRWRTNWSRG